MTADELKRQLQGSETLTVEAFPYLLVSLPWLRNVMHWLLWSQGQMTAEKLQPAADAGLAPEQMEEFVRRCFVEIGELRRIGENALAGSPLVFMRVEPQTTLPATSAPLPPWNPTERGN